MVTLNGKITNITCTLYLNKNIIAERKASNIYKFVYIQGRKSPKMFHSERQLLCIKPLNSLQVQGYRRSVAPFSPAAREHFLNLSYKIKTPLAVLRRSSRMTRYIVYISRLIIMFFIVLMCSTVTHPYAMEIWLYRAPTKEH